VEVQVDEFITLAQIDQAADYIRTRTKYKPRVGLILGSGLGELVEAVDQPDIIDTSNIPHWPVSTVQGHQGRLVIGRMENQDIIVQQGRAHYYEGYRMDQITLPVRVMQRLGIKILIVTNAAGAINPQFEPGEVMLITDQINLIGMTGLNPLRGPNLDEFGTRFPDMSQAYDRHLCALARQQGVNMQEGIYICLSGPSFESPADLRLCRTLGADAVGMSTVPEVIVARHGGLRVLGLSGISNKANLDGNTLTTHAEVLEAGKQIVPKLAKIVKGILKDI
jgi:purine-nucleoside phosphorylase